MLFRSYPQFYLLTFGRLFQSRTFDQPNRCSHHFLPGLHLILSHFPSRKLTRPTKSAMNVSLGLK